MLAKYPAHTTLPASNLQRVKKFYNEKLGLVPVREVAGGITYQCGGTWFNVFPSAGASNASFTQMGWEVDNIEAEVAALKARGIVFEEYNTPNLKTVNSVATIESAKAAWFKDTEGNLLGLYQPAKAH
jgi:catechol 2,3-dioxygenase-like lactoylglutathione lyase family enzyme